MPPGPPREERPPTRADILRGEYDRYRANNDLLFYHLDVRIDPAAKTICGKNTIRFKMLSDDTRIQLDLYANLTIDKILLGTTPLFHESGREWFGNAVSAADVSDMWIHEGWTTYLECLYVEYTFGRADATQRGIHRTPTSPRPKARSRTAGRRKRTASTCRSARVKPARTKRSIRRRIGG